MSVSVYHSAHPDFMPDSNSRDKVDFCKGDSEAGLQGLVATGGAAPSAKLTLTNCNVLIHQEKIVIGKKIWDASTCI